VKQRLALEAARNIDTVLFDKTGTLTRGEYGVTDILPAEGFSEEETLQLAASVNYFSEHLIAEALVDEARKRRIPALPAEKFERIPGKGARAFIEGVPVTVGSFKILIDKGIAVPLSIKDRAAALAKKGKTIIFSVKGETLAGAVALADVVREESKEAVARLKAVGIRTAMVTGDSEEVAKYVARELGLDEYFAKVLPEEKVERVRELQKRGLKVAMVGDGVNDAPALAASDVGIAIGAGTNVAIESAGIILVRNDPRDVSKIIALSRSTYSKMIQNLWWAAGYNIFAVPLAAGVLAHKGVFLEPAVAAILMSLSTVIVSVNAVLLRRTQL
jgi:Cu2+-exporting ATPase